MSLDIYLEQTKRVVVFHGYLTHNLNRMAEAAGLYYYLWRPDELKITKAGELIAPLTEGLAKLKEDPTRFKALNPENGWGGYEGLVEVVETYLKACVENPGAEIETRR